MSATTVPKSKAKLHPAPQLMPEGVEATEPEPAPAGVTVSVNCCNAKVAVTLRAASIVTVHGPGPVHAPLHPVKTEPVAGVGVRVTSLP